MRRSTTVRISVWLFVLSVRSVQAQEEVDPYLWLEEVEGEKALKWVTERSEATLAILKAQPLFEQTRQKALEILNSDKRIAYPGFQGR